MFSGSNPPPSPGANVDGKFLFEMDFSWCLDLHESNSHETPAAAKLIVTNVQSKCCSYGDVDIFGELSCSRDMFRLDKRIGNFTSPSTKTLNLSYYHYL